MIDHKDHALKQVENFLYDAMSADATAQEIYDVIKGVAADNYNVYKNATQKAYELLGLLDGNGVGHITNYDDTELMPNLQYTDEEVDAMCVAAEEEEELISEGYFKEDGFWRKSKIWTVEIQMDGLTGDAFIPIPDDLSDVVGWNVDDELEWCDNKNGSYILRKVTK